MSTQPLTEAERAAAEWFLADFESEYDSRGMSAEEFAPEARDIVAKLRPLLAAETALELGRDCLQNGLMSFLTRLVGEANSERLLAAIQAEFYDAMAGATEECGPMSAEGFRGLALMARQSLSRPTSEEHQP
jgi:hypothetical protein